LGIEAAVLSVAFGSRIIEKHFTIDNNYSDFHDHQLSANPVNFKDMVNRIRLAEKMLGDGIKKSRMPEIENKVKIRRSIVAKYDLKSGHILTFDDLDWVRPGGGIRPGDEETVIGKKLTDGIKAGEMIELNYLV
jgi:sialic acid synthase SpsE